MCCRGTGAATVRQARGVAATGAAVGEATEAAVVATAAAVAAAAGAVAVATEGAVVAVADRGVRATSAASRATGAATARRPAGFTERSEAPMLPYICPISGSGALWRDA